MIRRDRSRLVAFLAAAGIAAGVTLASKPSFATSVARCAATFPYSSKSEPVRIPANAPALVVVPGEASNVRYGGAVPAEGRAATIAPDAAQDGTLLIVPSTPWTAGNRYELSVAYDCPSAPARTATLTFDAAPATPLPTAIGSIRVAKPTYVDAHVVLTPTPEVAALAPVTRFELLVNGKPFQVLPYGSAQVDDDEISFEYRLCASSATGGPQGFDLELRAHVAGAAEDPAPATLVDVAVDCTRPAYLDAPPPPSDSGGCTSAPAPKTGGFGIMAVAAAIALGAVRRRMRVR